MMLHCIALHHRPPCSFQRIDCRAHCRDRNTHEQAHERDTLGYRAMVAHTSDALNCVADLFCGGIGAFELVVAAFESGSALDDSDKE